MFSIVWCSYWDYGINEPGGVMRYIGEAYDADDARGIIRQAWGDSLRHGWGPGRVVVTDLDGRRVSLAAIDLLCLGV